MRNSRLLTVLSLFLLVPASITRAQTITSVKGLVTAEFQVPEGKVRIYLPDDIRPGDIISGTIIAEPKGNNARQTERNLTELRKYSVNIDGNKFPVATDVPNFKWLVASDRKLSAPLELLNVRGTKVSDLKYQFISPVIGSDPFEYGCAIPSHVLTGAPIQIPGHFDGNAENTRVALNQRTLKPLAESPRKCIVEIPAEAKGPGNFKVEEAGEEKCSRQVSGVDLHVSAGRLNLRRGESTYIDVRVNGLENLPDKALLTVTNLSPTIVNMEGGNLQSIVVWPFDDTADTHFSKRFNVVSTTTGTFNVNIDLQLPEVYQNTTSTPTENIPPGYKKMSCECSASVSLTKTGNSFKAEAKGECKGGYGIGINTFARCEVLSTSYEWSIAKGSENANFGPGKSNTSSVTIRPKNNGPYIVCVTVTVTCVDGTVCKATACADQTGKTVDNPGTQTRPPTTPEDPKNPPTTEKPPTTTTSSKCKCGCTVKINETAADRKESSFAAVVTPACTGTFGTGNTRSVCAVAKIIYAWSITAGDEFAKIKGPANGAGVTVAREKLTPFSLRVDVTVTCNDGTVCTCYDMILVPGLEDKSCSPVVSERMEPAMDGGLKSKQIGIANTAQMPRDEFIALQAEAADWDQMVFRCVPSKPDCKDEMSERIVPLAGRVRFEWIIEGEGSFVKLGCLPDDKNAEGDRVIFKPPVVPLPVKASDTTIITIIKLKIIDDGSAATDPTKEKIITIKTKRSRSAPDKYSIDISGGTGTPPSSPASKNEQRTCKTVGPSWTPGDDLVTPVIEKPGIPDADKMVLGQWLLLSSNYQPDNDVARFTCTSTYECPVGSTQKSYPDKVEWTWQIIKGGGRFVTGDNGRVVIYEAPLDMNEPVREVIIKVTAKNSSGERKDPDKQQQEMVIKVYKPGVRLSHPDLTWLPEENNNLELKSELMYKDGDWKAGLAHMCRIHYFELLNVSTEKGVCLNAPEPKDANDCRDLHMKNEGQHESWDDAKGAGKCDLKELYQQARTKQPEKEYSITIYSKDFGSYGFLRSFANINKKTSLEGKPIYASIPVKAADVKHPQGRAKKTEYPDDRVTIPMDIDENRIADGGWTSTGAVKMTDPADNKIDEDDKPKGDQFKGDGFTTYEEYRGFKISTAAGVVHQRINYEVKDIFIRNESKLPLGLYDDISGLDVHEITEAQYVSDEKRFVNFNFNKSTHLNFEQRGLHLIDKGSHSSLLGIAYSQTGQPTVPNAEIEIRLYTTKIKSVVDKVNKGVDPADKLSYSDKLAAVVSHELLHGNNVCHHGEGDPEVERSFDLIHGLRSGNLNCVMRYDNVGTPLSKIPEKSGTDLCMSAAGTGYNANGQRFGNAADKRGNCQGQIRVSGAGGIPKSCGNR